MTCFKQKPQENSS